jgi:hypothetical protein
MEGRQVTHSVDLKSKFLGGMVGSALGDAIGELAFRGLGEAGLRHLRGLPWGGGHPASLAGEARESRIH